MPRSCIRRGSSCSDGGYAVDGGSRCRYHSRGSNWAKYKPAHRDVYASAAWTDLRARVLREEPVCAEPGCGARSTSVDHIIPLSAGGPQLERSNLRGMCYEHHKRRSSAQGGEARRKKKQQ